MSVTHHRQTPLEATLTVYHKGVYYVGIKMFNKLHIEIQSIYSKFKLFKVVSKHFLVIN
jgi:hypothetical protein